METVENTKLELATILHDLEEAVGNAKRVPLTNNIIINEDFITDCVDRIYAALPDEIKKAQRILQQSDKLLENVEGQGQRIIADAKEQALRMTEQSAIYKEAAAQADEMIAQAEQGAIHLRQAYQQDVRSEAAAPRGGIPLRFDRNSLVQGVLYREILGKPKALRRR